MGGQAANHSAALLETSGQSARAILTLDSRIVYPSPVAERVVRDPLQVNLGGLSTDIASRVNLGLVSTIRDFESVPHFRTSLLAIDFTCPVVYEFLNSDSVLNERRMLCTTTSDVAWLPGADHMTLVVDHAWDIAHRLRGHPRL